MLRECDEAPDVWPFDFYLESYLELSTCRNSGMGISPISWLAIKEYCTFHGLHFSVINLIIGKIDSIFIEYVNGKESN